MANEGPLVPPRPDPHDPAMEACVQALEAIAGEIRSELKAMRQDFVELKRDVADIRNEQSASRQEMDNLKAATQKIQIDLAEVKGRLSQIPTMIQLVTLVVTLTVAIWGMAFATPRFAGVH